jgi:hypothetical protein
MSTTPPFGRLFLWAVLVHTVDDGRILNTVAADQQSTVLLSIYGGRTSTGCEDIPYISWTAIHIRRCVTQVRLLIRIAAADVISRPEIAFTKPER